jgi:N-glycosylase/DNA lyase
MSEGFRSATLTAWSPWTPVDVSPAFSPAALAETLDGGQMFRFNKNADGAWTGIWGDYVARVRAGQSGAIEVSFPKGRSAETMPALCRLMGLERPYATYYASLPRGIDPVIDRAMRACEGLRIVNLPLGEALLSFLCSPMKRIAQIKLVLENIAAAFGTEIMPGVYTLPTWEMLAEVNEDDLRRCKLGYRAKSIAGTARRIAEDPEFLAEVESLNYAEARKKLEELPGVGGKIADCVLLYSGVGLLQPFPVDTWILKAMSDLYGLKGWEPEQTALFGRRHFGNLAGLAQQFLFVYARKGGK